MKNGRNGALFISARGVDEASVDCVVKVPGLMENAAMHPVPSLAEWLAAAVGQAIGIVIPTPLNVEITAEFAAAVTDSKVAAGLKKSLGSVYGSEFVKGQPMVRGDLLDASLRSSAQMLLGFDLLIHNADRRAENPNMFVRRDSLVAFDHGDAFSFLLTVLFAPDPAIDPLRTVVDQHPCTPLLKAWRGLDFTGFREALARLDDLLLSQIEAETPPEWCVGPADGKLAFILKTLRNRRDAVETWLPEVEAWLQSK